MPVVKKVREMGTYTGMLEGSAREGRRERERGRERGENVLEG